MTTTPCKCEQEAMALQFGRFRRISWRDALASVVAPAIRLHQYRELRSQSLRNALCAHDCRRGALEEPCE